MVSKEGPTGWEWQEETRETEVIKEEQRGTEREGSREKNEGGMDEGGYKEEYRTKEGLT